MVPSTKHVHCVSISKTTVWVEVDKTNKVLQSQISFVSKINLLYFEPFFLKTRNSDWFLDLIFPIVPRRYQARCKLLIIKYTLLGILEKRITFLSWHVNPILYFFFRYFGIIREDSIFKLWKFILVFKVMKLFFWLPKLRIKLDLFC